MILKPASDVFAAATALLNYLAQNPNVSAVDVYLAAWKKPIVHTILPVFATMDLAPPDAAKIMIVFPLKCNFALEAAAFNVCKIIIAHHHPQSAIKKLINVFANSPQHHICPKNQSNVMFQTKDVLGVRSQKTYPSSWSLTPLTALLLLGIAVLCLVVAPCQESHRLRLKGRFLWPTALYIINIDVRQWW
jgi:hypothetical protein